MILEKQPKKEDKGMQLEYLDGVFEEIDTEESRDISGGAEAATGIIGIVVVGGTIAVVGVGLGKMAKDAYEEQTQGGTLGDIQKGKGGGVKGGRN